MDLRYGPEYERFRLEVRDFLSESWPLSGDEAQLERVQQSARFRGRAIAKGYLARSVPRVYGGSEQAPDVLSASIIREEFARAGAPLDVGAPAAQLIPTLVAHGSEAQKRAYLPGTVTGELLWCQGYSEPGAGSDLASVQTRAELVDGEWMIHGQKIWTSYAHLAEMIYMLVRTEPAAAGKHAGLSYLLVDMHQPGIEVRPLKGINGDSHFNEVFFDGARAPADRIVGKRGQGWIVSRSTLQAERNVVATAETTLKQFAELVELAQNSSLGGRPAIADLTVRQRLIEIEGYVASHEYSSYRQLTCAAHGENPGLIGTMNKLVGSEIGTRMARLALDIAADHGLEAPVHRVEMLTGGTGDANPVARFLHSLSIRAGGGTSNIQRNIVGEHGLGLPRDLAVLKRKPQT